MSRAQRSPRNSQRLLTSTYLSINTCHELPAMNSNTDIQNLAGNHQAGHALQRAFYCDPGIFLSDREKILDNSWHMAGHGSRIPNEGDYFLFNICGEELIIVRGKGGDIYAHYNVCRHRGSRICRENSGRKSSLVCPYHAWTYNLDGSLRRARLMGEGFSPGNHALHPCHVNVLEGIIFVALGEEPVDFEESTAAYVDYLEFHGLKNAKTARRLELPTRANWKLVVENFIECYHCTPLPSRIQRRA